MAKPALAFAALVIGVALGTVAATYWHAPIAKLVGLKSGSAGGGAQEAGGTWTCGMHPQVIQNTPGDCPICRMKLTPARAESGGQSDTKAISIDPAVVQNMGVRTSVVLDGPLVRTIRAVGVLEEAQTSIRDINLRVSGWIQKLHVTSEGALVEAGAPLFDLFSPELRTAVDELIAARRARDESREGRSGLFDAAARRLQLLGLDSSQIEALSKLDRAPDTITFTSPIAGSVIEKPIVEGSAVSAGDRALRIVDHGLLWLDARVFEQDLPFVRERAKASAFFEARPRNTYEGVITFIHPHVDPVTRAGLARMEIRNPGLALKPGMYATVRIESQLAERAVLVPREAVIDTGESQVAMVALGGGRFEPRRVKLGLGADEGLVQVVSGLAAGEIVVTSGQFLLDSESRAREAIQKFTGGSGERPPPGPRLQITPAQQQKLDLVIAAYLAIVEALGAEQTDPTPINSDNLVEAARDLLAVSRGTNLDRIASNVARTSEAMRIRNIDRQREAFKHVSQAVIALVDASPPSPGVARVLYLMHCPMTPAPGDWLQDNDDMANPYYADDMKACGETVRTIPPQDEKP
jgi:RND family efflux transporter MFP subunit